MDLRVVRACLRYTQGQLGKELGIDRRRVSEIENGERLLRPPEAKLLHALIDRQPGDLRQLSSVLTGLDCTGDSR